MPMAWAERDGGWTTCPRFHLEQPPSFRKASKEGHICGVGYQPPYPNSRMLRPILPQRVYLRWSRKASLASTWLTS